jgi:putative Ca2+/H+ antiporter (TMEM165/GDT1 family)
MRYLKWSVFSWGMIALVTYVMVRLGVIGSSRLETLPFETFFQVFLGVGFIAAAIWMLNRIFRG